MIELKSGADWIALLFFHSLKGIAMKRLILCAAVIANMSGCVWHCQSIPPSWLYGVEIDPPKHDGTVIVPQRN